MTLPSAPRPLPQSDVPAASSSVPAVAVAPAAAVIQSADLLGTRQSVEIEHLGQRYRLQATRQGKLILTK